MYAIGLQKTTDKEKGPFLKGLLVLSGLARTCSDYVLVAVQGFEPRT